MRGLKEAMVRSQKGGGRMQRSSQVRTRGKQQISPEECCSDTVSPSAKRNKRASKMRTVDTAHVICVAGGGSIVLWQDAAEVAAAASAHEGPISRSGLCAHCRLDVLRQAGKRGGKLGGGRPRKTSYRIPPAHLPSPRRLKRKKCKANERRTPSQDL